MVDAGPVAEPSVVPVVTASTPASTSTASTPASTPASASEKKRRFNQTYLPKFLQSYDENGGKVVVHGADDDGRPVSHSFKLVESSLPGHKYGGTKAACITLCTAFAEDTVQNLNQRIDAAKGKEHDESEEDSGSCESASEGDEDEHGD
ncbi:hypothetical protein CLOP_g21862 [Closterium sp. NIES-67]|nr:hypothetical protein CLOP_g21862 [Closterium sp. NIES-67]